MPFCPAKDDQKHLILGTGCLQHSSWLWALEKAVIYDPNMQKLTARTVWLVWHRGKNTVFLSCTVSVRSSALLQMLQCQSVICICLRICPWITHIRHLFVDPSESLVCRGYCPADGLIHCKYSPSTAYLLLPATAVQRVALASLLFPLSFSKCCKPHFSH